MISILMKDTDTIGTVRGGVQSRCFTHVHRCQEGCSRRVPLVQETAEPVSIDAIDMGKGQGLPLLRKERAKARSP